MRLICICFKANCVKSVQKMHKQGTVYTRGKACGTYYIATSAPFHRKSSDVASLLFLLQSSLICLACRWSLIIITISLKRLIELFLSSLSCILQLHLVTPLATNQMSHSVNQLNHILHILMGIYWATFHFFYLLGCYNTTEAIFLVVVTNTLYQEMFVISTKILGHMQF